MSLCGVRQRGHVCVPEPLPTPTITMSGRVDMLCVIVCDVFTVNAGLRCEFWMRSAQTAPVYILHRGLLDARWRQRTLAEG